jgi:tetratricopeptide (TPR) repeat protein
MLGVKEPPQQLRTETLIAVHNYFAQIRLARATELAQSGRLLEAEAVLAENGELPRNARELDLLARIAARQGRFDVAGQRWKAAIQLEPGNEIYHRCLERLTTARRILRLIVNSQDTLLNVLVLMMTAFAAAVLLYTFRR